MTLQRFEHTQDETGDPVLLYSAGTSGADVVISAASSLLFVSTDPAVTDPPVDVWREQRA